MAKEIRVPALGESVTEATIAKWFKNVGDAVKADEPMVELETDKVTVEVPAPASGKLTSIAAAAGTTVNVGALLGAIEEGADPRSEGTQRETSASAQAMTQDLWDALQTTVVAYLQTVTLQSLADEQKAKGFQVQERRPVQKGVFAKPKQDKPRPSTPNSVFALANAWSARS